jgi:hypothetical protein
MLHTENPSAMEASMNRTALILGAAVTLAMLGACAPYGVSDDYYGGGGGYGGGYYEPDYYYGSGYNQPYVPYGAYGGGYYRGHRGGDHVYRGQDRYQGDRNQGDRAQGDARGNGRGDRQGNNQGNIQGTQDNNRAPRQDNNQANTAYRGGNTLPNGDRITRGNFWQLNQQPQQNAAPTPSNGQASDGQSGGGRGFGRGRGSN